MMPNQQCRMANDEALVGQLVRGRERCRQLIQLYQGAYDDFVRKGVVSLPWEKACLAVSQLLAHLRAFADTYNHSAQSALAQEHTARLLTETSDLLQGVLVMERELRESLLALGYARGSAPAGR